METRNGLYQDEVRMRTVVMGLLMPVITIAKENMVVNCYKNDEIRECKDEINQLKYESGQAQVELRRVAALERNVLQLAEHQKVRLAQTEGKFKPVESKLNQSKVEQERMRDDILQLEHQNDITGTKLRDMEDFILLKQKEQKLELHS